ncbi:MAG: hypothetical protein ACREBH_02545 [Candidatus Micrarchaeaceae archaeon]
MCIIAYNGASTPKFTVPASVTVKVNPLTPSLSLSNTLIDQGQSILFTANVPQNDIGPYTYNFIVFNSVSGNVIANQLDENVVLGSDSFLWPSYNTLSSNALLANVAVTDSNSMIYSSSSYHIGYNFTPTVSITPSSNAIMAGQTESYLVSVSGGTGPYTVELYNITGGYQQGRNAIVRYNSFNTISFITSATGTFRFNVIGTDIGTSTPYVFNSASSIITVQPSSSSGGGGTGGGEGGGGGGGSEKPTIAKGADDCYLISNVSQLNEFNITAGSEKFEVTENFVSPNEAGVVINGHSYLLQPNTTYNITGSPSATVSLLNISYLPIRDIITLQVCGTPTVPEPQIALTYIPIYVTVPMGGSILSHIDLQNIGQDTESVNLSIGEYPNMLTLSTNTAVLKPGGTLSIQVMFGSYQNTTPGRYTIPLNITALSSTGIVTTQTEYLTFDVGVQNRSNFTYTNQVDLVNSTSAATGILQISAPQNKSVSNITVRTIIPPTVANSLSQIVAYGLDNNKTITNGTYVINWYISSIPGGQSVYAYYTIVKPENTSDFNQIHQGFVSLPLTVQSKVLRITDVVIPTFYTNSTNRIKVDALYTGKAAQKVSFSLTSSSNVTIYNSTQAFMVQPDHYVDTSFIVLTGQEGGTLLMNLSASTAGASLYYPLSVIVFPKPQETITFSTIPQRIYSTSLDVVALGILAVLLIIVFLLVLIAKLKKKGKGSETMKSGKAAKKAGSNKTI